MTTGLSQTSTRQSVELNGVRMDYSLCRNGYGKPVVHGFIGNEHVLSCQLLKFSAKSALRAATSRLQQILAEGKAGER